MIIYICPQCNSLCTNKAKHNLSHSVNGNPGAWVELNLALTIEAAVDHFSTVNEVLEGERNV